MRGFPSLLSFVKKKGFENRVFEIRVGGTRTRRSVLIYIYNIYIYIYIGKERRKHPYHPIGDNYTHPFPFTFFYLKLKSFLRNDFKRSCSTSWSTSGNSRVPYRQSGSRQQPSWHEPQPERYERQPEKYRHRQPRECCLLVLNLVSSTFPCIRQPRPDSACLMFVVPCKYAHRRSQVCGL